MGYPVNQFNPAVTLANGKQIAIGVFGIPIIGTYVLAVCWRDSVNNEWLGAPVDQNIDPANLQPDKFMGYIAGIGPQIQAQIDQIAAQPPATVQPPQPIPVTQAPLNPPVFGDWVKCNVSLNLTADHMHAVVGTKV